jgi:hypothetical protein
MRDRLRRAGSRCLVHASRRCAVVITGPRAGLWPVCLRANRRTGRWSSPGRRTACARGRGWPGSRRSGLRGRAARAAWGRCPRRPCRRSVTSSAPMATSGTPRARSSPALTEAWVLMASAARTHPAGRPPGTCSGRPAVSTQTSDPAAGFPPAAGQRRTASGSAPPGTPARKRRVRRGPAAIVIVQRGYGCVPPVLPPGPSGTRPRSRISRTDLPFSFRPSRGRPSECW